MLSFVVWWISSDAVILLPVNGEVQTAFVARIILLPTPEAFSATPKNYQLKPSLNAYDHWKDNTEEEALVRVFFPLFLECSSETEEVHLSWSLKNKKWIKKSMSLDIVESVFL